HLCSVLSYFRNYISEFFQDTDIRLTINFPEEIPDLIIHPDLKRNLLLVLKESLNNILKHSQANRVAVQLHLDGPRYLFEISDNGKGMPHCNGKEFGNGLKNMKQRMEEMNGTFRIISRENKGTLVLFEGNLL